MRLRTLATICLFGALACVVTGAAVGWQVWRDAQESLREVDALEQVRNGAHRIDIAIRYLLHIRAEPEILRGLAAEAAELQAKLDAIGLDPSERARLHLAHIEALAQTALESLPASDAGSALEHARLRPLADQMRIHESGAQEDLQRIIDARNRELFTGLLQRLGLMVAASVSLLGLALLAFWLVFQRIGRPLADFASAVRRFGDGEDPVEVEIRGRHELAEIGQLFNRALRQRGQALEELERAERRFRQLSEHVSDAFWFSRPGGEGVEFVTPAVERIAGLSPDELYADPRAWLALVHPGDLPRVLEFVEEQRQRPCELEYRIVDRKGQEKWVQDRRFPVAAEDRPETLRVIGVVRDVSERKRSQLAAQQRAREQQCLYKVLQLTTEDFRQVGEICAELVDLVPRHLLHRDAAVARIELDSASFLSTAWSAPVSSLRAEIATPAGGGGWIEIGYRIPEPDLGEGEGPFLREERQLLDAIAGRVTRMLQARQTRENLVRSERLKAIGQLTGGIAHDFNNLLTVIQGNADLLAESLHERDDPLGELAEMIDDAARRAAHLTQHMLAFARKQTLDPRVVDPNELIRGVEPLLRRSLGEHIDLELKLAEDVWPVSIDPTQLETSVLNLALNAREAMPEGGTLTLETRNARLEAGSPGLPPDAAPGEVVRISVSDTGCGIAPEQIPRVFEPFFTTRRKGRGTGLGLSMVYGFVKQSRGHVALVSELGKGTTVHMDLPRADGTARPWERTATPSLPPQTHGKGLTLLLVEDDDLVRGYTRRQLEAAGHRVLTASDGSSALELLRGSARIDLLVSDVVMPGGITGHELADAAGRLRPEMPVLLMSGYAESGIDDRKERGGHGAVWLDKPFRRDELLAKIRDALAAGTRKRAQRDARSDRD